MVKLYFDKETKKWTETDKDPKVFNEVIVIDRQLLPVLDKSKKDLRKDLDVMSIIVGEVGHGKSNLARICARYVTDENFNPKHHIVKNVEDIKPVFLKAKKYEAVIFDEGSGIFSTTDTLTKKTKYASFILDVCRQKNLFLIIVAPRFHRLKPDVALDRSKFLLRAYLHSRDDCRGPFAFYGTRLKEKIYFHLKKNYGNYKGTYPNWYGSVGKDYLAEEEYIKQKDETFKLALDDLESKKITPTQTIKSYEKKLVSMNPNKKTRELAELLGCSERKIERLRKALREEAENRLSQFSDIMISKKPSVSRQSSK